jgi:ABC-2 type transport system ATP-binding protein
VNVVETKSLGRRYGRRWVLRGLDLTIPQHAVVGLVGPNGAGKSTLLHLVAGLISPSEGSVSVLGRAPGSRQGHPDIAFVAQDAPLPKRESVGGTVTMAAAMNHRWDDEVVTRCLETLDIGRTQRVDGLSGGQRAQFALALALAKRPKVLLLDEPVASLDPLARRGFLQSLMAAAADGGLTVVFSTHLLDDLERTCDHLVVLGNGAMGGGLMLSVALRRFRSESFTVAAGLLALSLLAIITGHTTSDQYNSSDLADCLASETPSICINLRDAFGERFASLQLLIVPLILLPALFGAFVGAPLVARELEHRNR